MTAKCGVTGSIETEENFHFSQRRAVFEIGWREFGQDLELRASSDQRTIFNLGSACCSLSTPASVTLVPLRTRVWRLGYFNCSRPASLTAVLLSLRIWRPLSARR